jgi:FkbM family methyltransferase
MSFSKASSDSLENVLTVLGSPSEVLAQETSTFESVAQGRNKVVIFGCGYLGKLALSGAIRAGLDVVAFADNNRYIWGQVFEGITILSPSDAIAQYNEVAFFVVAIYNGTPPRKQLHDLGCRRVVPYPVFFWRFSRFMPTEDRLELPHRILENVDRIREGYGLLSDTKSCTEFANQVQWRCSMDYSCLSSPAPAADMYYAPDLIRLLREEVLVDCGAFDGDSIRMFLARTAGAFRHIYALEPDPKNLAALKAYLSSLAASEAGRVSMLPFGASDRSGTAAFNATGTVGSSLITGGGSENIECRRLDDVLDDPAPTFIKMDIEGAELKAIVGATETIRKARPILAVCAYHRCEHLWTLPVLIHSVLTEYNIFLRRYAEECWETVYYAIPPERLISGNGMTS